jgi:hypothetical protein
MTKLLNIKLDLQYDEHAKLVKQIWSIQTEMTNCKVGEQYEYDQLKLEKTKLEKVLKLTKAQIQNLESIIQGLKDEVRINDEIDNLLNQ